MNNVIVIPMMYPVSSIEPIEPKCKKCGHSFKNHNRISGCTKGIISKCTCTRFEFDKEKFDEIKNEIETKLFKYVAEAKRLGWENTEETT